jgi:hypothetical protein
MLGPKKINFYCLVLIKKKNNPSLNPLIYEPNFKRIMFLSRYLTAGYIVHY